MPGNSKILKFCLSQQPRYFYLRLLFIVVAAVAAYSNSFNAPFIFDDAANIIDSPIVRSFNATGFKEALHSRRAFGLFTFQFNYFLSGAAVFSYHLVNIIIHLSAALMVYGFVALLLKTPYWDRCSTVADKPLPIPFFTALFFVLHPLQTQAVTYIVQRFTSLATLLYLAAVVCYLKGRIGQQSDRPSYPKVGGWFALSLLSGLLAVYTKEIAYTVPLVLLVVELLFFDLSRAKLVKLSLAAVTVMIALLAKLSASGVPLSDIISRLDETTRVQTIIPRWDYLITQFRVICTYLRLLFLPVNQNVEHYYSLSHSFFDWQVLLAFLLLLALILLSLWLVRVSEASKPHLRLVAFGIFWFFITLAIESSVLPIIDLIFEHRVYLPSVGFFMAVVAPILKCCSNFESEKASQSILISLLLLAMLCAGATWQRNLVWANESTLWEDTVAKNPKSARAWNNLGRLRIISKQGEDALRALIKSVELDQSWPGTKNNIGMALDLMGAYRDRFNRTSEMFNDPAVIKESNVNRWQGDVHNNLGLAYELTGNLPKAAENYRNAIGFNPALGLAYYNLGIVSVAMKDYEKYSEQLQILFMVDPLLAERLKLRVGDRNSR